MLQELDYLRELNIWSVMLRLTVAMVFGGLIGLERGRKGRAAGLSGGGADHGNGSV